MGYSYIVLEVETHGLKRELPVIFPDIIVHEDMAKAVQAACNQYFQKSKPVAAGQLDLHGGVECTGKSTTLKLKSRGDKDRTLIITMPYFHGIK
jgi:hypothetical protein